MRAIWGGDALTPAQAQAQARRVFFERAAFVVASAALCAVPCEPLRRLGLALSAENFLSEVQRRAPSWTRALDTLGPSFLPRQGGARTVQQDGLDGLPTNLDPKGNRL